MHKLTKLFFKKGVDNGKKVCIVRFKLMRAKQKTLIKNTMKTQDTTIGSITTREEAQRTADQWRNPEMGFHTQVIEKDGGYICRLVVND